jgi:hypothetical protein
MATGSETIKATHNYSPIRLEPSRPSRTGQPPQRPAAMDGQVARMSAFLAHDSWLQYPLYLTFLIGSVVYTLVQNLIPTSLRKPISVPHKHLTMPRIPRPSSFLPVAVEILLNFGLYHLGQIARSSTRKLLEIPKSLSSIREEWYDVEGQKLKTYREMLNGQQALKNHVLAQGEMMCAADLFGHWTYHGILAFVWRMKALIHKPLFHHVAATNTHAVHARQIADLVPAPARKGTPILPATNAEKDDEYPTLKRLQQKIDAGKASVAAHVERHGLATHQEMFAGWLERTEGCDDDVARAQADQLALSTVMEQVLAGIAGDFSVLYFSMATAQLMSWVF